MNNSRMLKNFSSEFLEPKDWSSGKNGEYVVFDIMFIRTTRDMIVEACAIKIDNNCMILDEIEIRSNIVWPSVNFIGRYSEKEILDILMYMAGSATLIGFDVARSYKLLKGVSRLIDLRIKMIQEFGIIEDIDFYCNLYDIEVIGSGRASFNVMKSYEIIKKLIYEKRRN